jgi:hypothetical protein
MNRLTKKQKRMFKMVNDIKKYIDTYDKQIGYLDYTDDCFISDMIYAIGLSLDPKANEWATGFIKFKKELYCWLAKHEGRVN